MAKNQETPSMKPSNTLTVLLGEPESNDFSIEQHTNPPWFTPDLPALCSSSHPAEQRYTFAELKAQVKALGSGLRKAGLQGGDRLILMSTDSVYVPLFMLGTWAAGGIFVARGVDYTASQQADFIKHAKPKVVVAISANMDTATEAVRLADPSFKSIYELDDIHSTSQKDNRGLPWKKLLDHAGGPNYAWPKISNAEQMETTILIEYTSGTTSTPKGAEHTHRSLTALVTHEKAEPPSPTQPTALTDFTFAQIAAKILFLLSLANRRLHTVYDPPGPFATATYLSHISQHRPQHLPITKRTLDALVSIDVDADTSTDRTPFPHSSVHSILTSSQIIPQKTRRAVRDLCGGRDILTVGYGTTEAFYLLSKSPDGTGSSASTCVGSLWPGVEGKVVDDAGDPVASAGQEGRLLFRTPTLMKGYFCDPAQTAATIDAEGWYDTGDLGYVDAGGEWHVTGRTKEIIKVRGKSVSPAAIEETILKIPGVSVAVVTSVVRAADGEELPVAFVVRGGGGEGVREGHGGDGGDGEVREADVHGVMAREMNAEHQITGGIVWLEAGEVPYAGNGKVARQVLKRRGQELWDRGTLGGAVHAARL